MYRLWGKLMKNHRIVQDNVVPIEDLSLSKEEMVRISLESLCYDFDIEKPIWLTNNSKEIKMYNKTCFRQDNFIEQIDFDYLEVEIFEEVD